MFDVLSLALFAAAATGLVVLLAQLVATGIHLRDAAPAPSPEARRPISILKPLCGVDDGLAANLEHFATLDYPDYELLLGVRSTDDAAFPLALDVMGRHPDRVRVYLQRGEPGLNPKVNQLITLAAQARHDFLLISDSNVRTRPGYLDEIAAHLDDPQVGLVTHPIVGVDERRLGSRLDHLHLACWSAPGIIAAKRLASKDIVTGKSMAMRRQDVRALGGFEAVCDVLAEDYVLGLAVSERLGKRVALGSSPIENVSTDRSLADFISRHLRWSVMQRKMAGPAAYLAILLLNPILLAMLALACAPGELPAALFTAITCAKLAVDGCAGAMLRPGGFSLATLLLVPAKDLLAALAWLQGLLRNTVVWRGNRLAVLSGTRLAPVEGRGYRPAAPGSATEAA